MTKIKVEEINNINLDNGKWWQPKIDKKLFKELSKRSDSKAWFHTILYFSTLILKFFCILVQG